MTGINRILVLKLDHIGDILIAAPALALLRRCFSTAHITLVCGPWNVGLARRLGIADEIHDVLFFSTASILDADGEIAAERRRHAKGQLESLGLHPFDLAIDLRRDEDTRALLKLFESRHYAGFGSLEVFSYLDVALPFARHGPAAGATQLRLSPRDLNQNSAHIQTAGGLHLTANLSTLEVTIQTDQLWAPGDDGLPDWRPLGVALWRIDVDTIDRLGGDSGLTELPRNKMDFGPGWFDWEPWGRWSSMQSCGLTLSFPARSNEIRLALSVQGHTSISHPLALVRVTAGGATTSQQFRVGDGPATLMLQCHTEIRSPEAISDAFLMRGGRYRGSINLTVSSIADWVPLTLSIRSVGLGQTLAKLRLPDTVDRLGSLTFPFEIEIKDSADPISIELTAERPDDALAVAIVGIELDWMQGKLPALPTTHMAEQLLDLIAMTALRYSGKINFDSNDVRDALCASRPGSSATEAVARIRQLRRRRWPFRTKRRPLRIIGIGIGANKETKRWPIENFVKLGRQLLMEGCIVVLIGGPQERAEAEELAGKLAQNRVINLCGCCKIEDLGEVLAELDGFIGLDTGTTHFAGRVGLKTFALFGASHDPLEWGPVGNASGWAVADVPCAGCSKALIAQCDYQLSCMTLLTPEQVWPALNNALLSQAGESSRLIVSEQTS